MLSNQSRYKRLVILAGIALLVVAILFFVIGFVSKNSDCEDGAGNTKNRKKPDTGKMTNEEREKLHQSIVDFMKTDNLKENMNYFAAKPHVASRPRTFKNSAEIYKRFKEYGFEPSYHEYETILAYSKLDNPNYVSVKNANGEEVFRSQKIEKTYPKYGEIEADSLPPFLAYSMNGSALGKDLIYVNFGLSSDFAYLKFEKNVSFEGKIVLAKYGRSGRGNKVRMAEEFNASGILIYGDPQQYAPVPSQKFPFGRWLSDDGVQRGSIIGGKGVPEGDPMSDGYPAKSWAYRPDKLEDVKGISKIPAQPIAASDAEKLLKLLGGEEVQNSWKGNLNVTYRYGPQANESLKFDLVVNNENKFTGIRNVCGKLRGQIEPDRYVLLGNHIDSWVYGSVDATSGTTVMMEIARALAEKYKEGWRPRRSIMLCGWDGEESGLIGSVEYVEEFYNQLHDKAIAYINIDSAVAGNNSLLTAASPLLHDMMFDVHKRVPDPYRDETVFDRCMIEYIDDNYNKTHNIGYLGAGSDYFAFYKFMGIPSIDMSYRQSDLDKKYNTSYYPQYHTLHDTIYWMENFVDKEYKVHLTVAKVGLLYLLQLADTPLIPFTFQRYDEFLNRGVDALQKKMKVMEQYGEIKDVDILLKPLLDGVKSFGKAVKTFTTYIKKVKGDKEKLDNPIFLRMINDKIMQLEKGFTYPKGIPGRSQLKHYLMTSSKNSADRYCPLPAISDLLPDIRKEEKLKEFKIQISITTSLIRAVAESLSADLDEV